MPRSLFFFLTPFLSLFGTGIQASVDVVVETKVFHIPGGGPRAEVNMAILGGSMVLLADDMGFMQARVNVLTLIELDGAIKAYAKTDVSGPGTLADSIFADLVHQELFDLPPGSYDLLMEFRDLNSTDTTVRRHAAPLVIAPLENGVVISDILLAERMEPAPEGSSDAKYGYRITPLLSDYYPSSLKTLSMYAEVYGTEEAFGQDGAYLLSYQIESYEKRTVYGAFKRNIRAKARPVEPLMAQFDIGGLPSGNYLVVVEVRDRQGELVSRRERMIQRNNPIRFSYDLQSMNELELSGTFAGALMDRDSLAEHISSLRPIADPLERKIIDDRRKDRDLALMRRFFYSFWANRSTDPEAAWNEYRQQVVKVNKLFGCRVLKGYESDRGQVYLKYGAPNSMMDRLNEMDSYPYSIWHYYQAGRYRDKRFVFYQPNLASDCMELLHSEVPGELQNPRWNQILHSRNVAMPNVDPANVGSKSGERAREFFDMPR